jgi:DNA-binding transcriptional regulator YdaS (Cro superfamily)
MVAAAEKIIASELAKRKGVSKATVSQMTKRGKLHRARDGTYDLSHPDNASYLANVRRQQRKPPRPGAVALSAAIPEHRAPTSVTERKSVTISQERTVSSEETPKVDGLTITEWELRKTSAQAKQVEQKTAIERGDYVLRSEVRMVIGQLDGILSGEIGTLDQRIASNIVAQEGLPAEREPMIAAVIKDRSLGAISQIKTLLKQYVQGLESNE